MLARVVSAPGSLLGQHWHHSGFKSVSPRLIVLFSITQAHIYCPLFLFQTHLRQKKKKKKSPINLSVCKSDPDTSGASSSSCYKQICSFSFAATHPVSTFRSAIHYPDLLEEQLLIFLLPRKDNISYISHVATPQ